METVTISVYKKIEEGVSDVVGVTNSCRFINYMMNNRIGKRVVKNIVNEKEEVINRDQKWVVGDIIIGPKIKEFNSLLGSKPQ